MQKLIYEEREFQSLFFWNSRPDRSLSRSDRRHGSVSILVFLELAPGLSDLGGTARICRSFNPCFSGTRARTRGWVMWRYWWNEFQSLFFWNSRPDQEADERHRGATGFQSLFFWNSRPDGTISPPAYTGWRVSILVFLELAPGRGCSSPVRDSSQFQSLFFWNSRPDSESLPVYNIVTIVSILVFLELAPGRGEPSKTWRGTTSFNPCFSGTRARTKEGGEMTIEETSFNPCFSGTRARTR